MNVCGGGVVGWSGLILLCALLMARCEPADPAGPLLSDLPDGLWQQRYPELHRKLLLDRKPPLERHHDDR